MITTNSNILDMITSPVRTIGARVELYEGSTLLEIFKHNGALKSFSIDRLGDEGKFFGFGVCQRLNVHLIDRERRLNITTANTIEIEFGVEQEFLYPYPVFHVSEVHRDENTNELSITAYDAIYETNNRYVNELSVFGNAYTIGEFTKSCASFLGLPLYLVGFDDESVFDTYYPGGANFEGTETIRSAMNAIAEATQSIYYIDSNWNLVFRRLDKDGEPVLPIQKADYITLTSGDNRRLTAVCHATELGDNVYAGSPASGTTQYVRDNPFWDLRDDIDVIVENALAVVSGFTLNQFVCSWRGNFLLEIGDKIAITTKDDDIAVSYALNDTITYNGFLSERTQWNYIDNEGETPANPSTLGDKLKQTFAKVDKVNKEISLLASDTEDKFSSMQLTTKAISAEVQGVSSAVEGTNGEIAKLTEKVSAAMTKDAVEIVVQSELAKGVDKVETSTGYKFDKDGMTISKSDSEISTQITEDGMTVRKGRKTVLVANNEGVQAVDLHATTYLKIGKNSRIEDWGRGTAVFYVG